MLGIVTRIAAQRHPLPIRMRKVPVTALPAAIHEPALSRSAINWRTLRRI
jgi:hypothetical protein